MQCVLSVAPDVVSLQMVKFATGLSKDSYVDIEGIISVPKDPIIVKKLYCISKAVPALPINIEDAARGEIEIEKALQIRGSSEGGSAVFKLDYKGPVFRADDSHTHRHLCEFTGLDVEMEIKEHYSEVMDIVDRLFVAMFDSLNEKCQKELEAIGKQYPFEPLKSKIPSIKWYQRRPSTKRQDSNFPLATFNRNEQRRSSKAGRGNIYVGVVGDGQYMDQV
ncbi:hypothetical protein TEA_002031 [Camellia sinensis var. sinensis]|uniref:Aminoacyl-tRNA synthetase class II (D/K/N) domain-containing protein n=1 Tax=Camellia sinensis var. sinensis TaxID=542762 RepID=A0A4S4CVL5_CAMSN|nr:hypothetical protein TEA_002031 [Camellia sinensis var. sinensis]